MRTDILINSSAIVTVAILATFALTFLVVQAKNIPEWIRSDLTKLRFFLGQLQQGYRLARLHKARLTVRKLEAKLD